MKAQINLITSCTLLIIFLQSISVYSQDRNVKKGLSTRKVTKARAEIIESLRDETTAFLAIKNKELLLENQPNLGDYLSYDEYFMILFLSGEFDEILEPVYTDELRIIEKSPVSNYELELWQLLVRRRIKILNEIDQKHTAAERIILKSKYYEIKDKPKYTNNNDRNLNLPVMSSLNKETGAEKFFPDNQFIYLFNDSIIKCPNITYQNKKFTCGGLIYKANNVKFYADGLYFYANIKNAGETPDFYKRYYSGSVNIYSREFIIESGGYYSKLAGYTERGVYFESQGAYIPKKETQFQKHYYNFGYGDIKKTSYENLVQDISDNLNSKLHLDIYHKKKRTENTLTIVGASLVAGGLAFIGTSNEALAIGTVSGLTVLLINIGIIQKNDKNKDLEKALHAYN